MSERPSYFNPSEYDMPKPTRFAILDDLSNGDEQVAQKIAALASLVNSENKALVLEPNKLEEKLRAKYIHLTASKKIPPIDIALAIGGSGEKVARNLGLDFPTVKIAPTREKENGKTKIVTKSGKTLAEEVRSAIASLPKRGMKDARTIGLIDDTIFSGQTIQAVISNMPEVSLSPEFVALTLTYVPSMVSTRFDSNLHIVSGITLQTLPDRQRGVNSIDARDFISSDALRLSEGASIPFMKEENWMRSWFGNNYEEAQAICQELSTLSKS